MGRPEINKIREAANKQGEMKAIEVIRPGWVHSKDILALCTYALALEKTNEGLAKELEEANADSVDLRMKNIALEARLALLETARNDWRDVAVNVLSADISGDNDAYSAAIRQVQELRLIDLEADKALAACEEE